MGPSPRELGPGGTGTGPLRARPKDSGTGQPIDKGQGRVSPILCQESSGWDGLKPRDHSLTFPLVYCRTLSK